LGETKTQAILQIKGRNFEVPGCGGFLLTNYIKGIEEYFSPDKDIVCYNSENELIEKIRYYLQNENLRQEIASNGLKTTLAKHTYVHRFNEIFQRIGLDCNFSINRQIGSTEEIINRI
jgi:spore maturation protein CgeB